jgi:hypothetical protein
MAQHAKLPVDNCLTGCNRKGFHGSSGWILYEKSALPARNLPGFLLLYGMLQPPAISSPVKQLPVVL